MTKLKEGRPKKSDGMFTKYKQVYEAMPENEPIRFITLADKLKPMSRSTITKALQYGVFIGLLNKDRKSAKDITYSKSNKITRQTLDNIEQQMQKMENLGYDYLQKRVYFLFNILPIHRRDFLLQIKKDNPEEDLIHTQAIFLNFTFGVIEQSIQKALSEYAHETNMQEAKKGFNERVHSIIIPLISELTDYIDDVGLNDKVIQALWLCNRRVLSESDFADYPLITRLIKQKEIP